MVHRDAILAKMKARYYEGKDLAEFKDDETIL